MKMERIITEEKVEVFQVWLKDYLQVHNATLMKYTFVMRRLQDYMDGREVTKELLEEYKSWLVEKKHYKKSSVNSFLYIINNFCHVMEWGDITPKGYSLGSSDLNTGAKYVARQDYQKLVTTALQHENFRLAMMIQTLCHMDIRFSEFDRLTVEAVKKGYVTVVRGKRERQIEMPDYLKEALEDYAGQKEISEGIIFRTAKGKTVNRSNLYREIKALCELADVDSERVQMIKFKMPRMHDYYPFYRVDWKEKSDI
jgi:site-specific recombinase XerD